MHTNDRVARMAGALYVMIGVPAAFSLFYVPCRLIEPGNASATASNGTGTVNLEHYRVWVAGADAAMNAGRYGLRAEAAYMGTEDDRGSEPFMKNHNVFIVVGADRAFSDRLNLNVQYMLRYIRQFSASDVGIAYSGSDHQLAGRAGTARRHGSLDAFMA